MPLDPNCPACEAGDCLEHGGAPLPEPSPAPAPAPVADDQPVTRAELEAFKKKVAKAVKRTNRAIKAARQRTEPPDPGIVPPPTPPEAPQRRKSEIEKLGGNLLSSMTRRKK